jgi:MFS family permease
MFMATLDGSIVIIALPAIFRGIHLDPLAPGSISYLLWMIMGYRLVQAVLVVTVGRLGDMFGRVRIYNSGFVVFTVASILLSFDPFTGGHGALWLIGWRLLQAVGGSMLMANSAAILTDAFPAEQRGFALGTNQVAGLAGMFVGLVAGGLLAAIDWRWVFWVNVPVGIYGTIWAYLQLRDNGERHPARIDWWGNVTFAVGLSAVLIAVTYGIQPYGGHTMGWTSPWVLAGLAGGSALLAAFVILETRIEARCSSSACSASALSRLATWLAWRWPSPAAGCSSCSSSGCRGSGCRCMATTTARPRCGRASSCFPSPPGSWSRGRSRASCPTSLVRAASRPPGWRSSAAVSSA